MRRRATVGTVALLTGHRILLASLVERRAHAGDRLLHFSTARPGQQTGSKRQEPAPLNHAEWVREKPENPYE